MKNKYFPLFLSSFFLTVSRGVTFPFLAVFLTTQRGLTLEMTGLVLTCGILSGLALSSFCGKLIGIAGNKGSATCSMIMFTVGYAGLSLSENLWLIVGSYTLTNLAYSVYSVVVKLEISGSDDSEKAHQFSVNYTFINIGWVAGPALGTLLLHINASLIFWVSAAISMILALLSPWLFRSERTDAVVNRSNAPDYHSSQDVRRFIMIIFAGLLFSFCYGRFSSSISQILIATLSPEETYKIITLLLITNAVFVIVFQIPLGRRVNTCNLTVFNAVGAAGLITGVIIFSLAGTSGVTWITGMIFFSLGEVLLNPVQYLLADGIRYRFTRAGIFSVQTLTGIGGAVNPAITGWFVERFSPASFYYVMAVSAVGGGLMINASIKRGRKNE
ncbi:MULTISPECIES: MFS transporter [Pectobacteriaceae]|uniref:MFS transporter n=1 Tax=Pectobacteriaceae TaxID=1903410 RepID=UPI0013155CA0|nr:MULTISPECIES: MFS transporter [Pectobacteriaceae]UJR57355.1 MFS transporter [Dickeya zeae]